MPYFLVLYDEVGLPPFGNFMKRFIDRMKQLFETFDRLASIYAFLNDVINLLL